MAFGKKNDNEDVAPFGGISAPLGNSTTSSVVDAHLGKGVKISGTIVFSGSAEVEGQIDGEVKASDRLVIGEAAVLKAKVTGIEIVVKGTVHGDIVASKRLILKKPAKVVGNLTAALLSIEEGVSFEGKCSMGSTTGASSDDKSNVVGMKTSEVKTA